MDADARCDTHMDRTRVLEDRMTRVEVLLGDRVAKLDALEVILYDVKEHIARQNGSIPRILSSVETLSNTVNSQAGNMTEFVVRQKITWAIGSAILMTLIGIAAKLIFGS